MKKLVIGGIVAAVVLGGAAFGFSMRQTPAAGAAAAAVPITQEKSGQVVAEGQVVPVRDVRLSPAAAGRVAEVLVKEGDRVEAGQVILRQDAARQAATVAQADAGFRRAQARLQELKAGARPEEVATAQAALDAAQAQLARIQQGAKAEDIRAAEANLASAQAALAKLKEGSASGQLIASRTEVLNAASVLQQAQAQVDALRAAARPADIAAAEADVRRATAQLALINDGARTESIAAAEADVASAQATLDQAKAALAETELKAPFAGTIAELTILPGEQAAPGAAVATLADFSSWQIETTDLTELSVVKVQPGSRVMIALDAIPGLELPGEVVRINSVGKDKRGDINYTAIIKPLKEDPRMRWNMTAALTFEGK